MNIFYSTTNSVCIYLKGKNDLLNGARVYFYFLKAEKHCCKYFLLQQPKLLLYIASNLVTNFNILVTIFTVNIKLS